MWRRRSRAGQHPIGANAPTVPCDHVAAARGSIGTLAHDGMSEDQIFVREILELAVAAPGLPEGVRGWTGGKSAQRALESLRSSKVAVLAIYVYDRVVWGFAPGQESWACRRVAQEQS